MNQPYPKGTRVEKIGSDHTDTHGDGALATVLESFGPISSGSYAGKFGYFVEWDDLVGIPVFISEHRIRPKSDA